MCGYILGVLFGGALLRSLRLLVLLACILPAAFFKGFRLRLVYEETLVRLADVILPFQRLLIQLDVVLVPV